jgi:hypothetical protein
MAESCDSALFGSTAAILQLKPIWLELSEDSRHLKLAAD